MATYHTRVGEVTAAATGVALSPIAGGTGNEITIPTGHNKIIGIIGVAPTDAAANGACAAVVRITGNALKEGQQDICIGGNLVDGTAAAAAFISGVPIPLNIPVTSNNQILLTGFLEGDDTGDLRFGVTIITSA